MQLNIGSTKEAIFDAALALFATNGYHNVSMREIAAQVQVKPASIYNHFDSKEAILQSIYDFFWTNVHQLEPNLDDLLKLVETEHPHTILQKTLYYYPEEIHPRMSKILLISSLLWPSDERAAAIIDYIMDQTVAYDTPLLKRMQELDLIEPLNIKHFINIHTSCSHTFAVRFYSNKTLDNDEYYETMNMVFQLIKPKQK